MWILHEALPDKSYEKNENRFQQVDREAHVCMLLLKALQFDMQEIKESTRQHGARLSIMQWAHWSIKIAEGLRQFQKINWKKK